MILIHEVQWNNGSGLTLIQSRDIQITQIKDNLWNLPATASRSLYTSGFWLVSGYEVWQWFRLIGPVLKGANSHPRLRKDNISNLNPKSIGQTHILNIFIIFGRKQDKLAPKPQYKLKWMHDYDLISWLWHDDWWLYTILLHYGGKSEHLGCESMVLFCHNPECKWTL